jgi:rhodanese-related sulfurtransferase
MGTPTAKLRIDPAGARRLIEDGVAVVIDLTSSFLDPAVRGRIAGSIRVSPGLVLDRNRHAADVLASLPPLPRDRTVIAYCTCPDEEASARLAQLLRHDGYDAWALAGGLPAWRAAGYPMEPVEVTAS